jgi:hypothetical protein
MAAVFQANKFLDKRYPRNTAVLNGFCCSSGGSEDGVRTSSDARPEPDSRNDEHINGSDVRGVIAQEDPPALRGMAATAGHVLGDGGLRDVNTERQQLTINAWRAPERIIAADRSDQITDVGRDRRPTGTTAGFPAPVETETASMPAHQRLRPEDDRGSEQ